jgi:DNA modification methylase
MALTSAASCRGRRMPTSRAPARSDNAEAILITHVGKKCATSKIMQEDKEWHGETLFGRKWSVYQGNAEEVLRRLPAESVNCVVTSPPYFWLRDYGVDGQIGMEETVEGYIQAISGVMDEVMRVLCKDGLLFLNIGDTYYSGKGKSHGIDRKSNKRRFGLRLVDKSGGLDIGIQRKSTIGVPWRVAIEMSTRQWVLRSPILWHREHCLPEHVRDRPSRSYEYVFMFAKDRHYFFNKKPLIDHKIEEDMWTIAARPKNSIETAPFPDELVKRCLEIGCKPNGAVLDPFLGSGTTARVALAMNYSVIGIDLKREFCLYAASQLGA